VKTCLAIAEQLLKSDKVPPVRQILEKVSTRWVHFEELSDLPGSQNFFTNVNTPQEFLKASVIYQQLQKG
jgi:molybdopterin-guanine dinucleotide biosynthesis protein A